MPSIPHSRHFRSRIAAAVLSSATVLIPVAQAEAYSGLVVFGDSVSDSGNVALAIGQPNGVQQQVTGNSYIPDYPYFPSGRFSDGPVWAEGFAAGLGLPLLPSLVGGNNYAFAGARTAGNDVPVPSLNTQAQLFLGNVQGVAPSDALYVLAEVGNDARDALTAIAGGADPQTTMQLAAINYAGDLGAIVDSLRAAGAQHFLVFDNVNLGLVPAVVATGGSAAALASSLTLQMNDALNDRLQGAPGVTLFDTYSFLSIVVQNPGAFGFGNATDACGAIAQADCSSYVFWDGLHPTAAMHHVIAEAALAAVPEPAPGLLLLAGGLMLVTVRRWQRP
jgi:outer membrane lipase/esterase